MAPPRVKRRIAGVPVIVIFGALTFLTGVFIVLTTASPYFTGAPLNPYYLLGTASVFILGLVIYEISYYYQRSKGIDVSLRFKQIPPE